jgi:peroxiredoxin
MLEKKIKSGFRIGTIVVAALGFCVAAYTAQVAEPEGIVPGAPAKFALKDSNKKAWSVPVAGKKAIIVGFWTPASGDCIKQFQRLQKIVASRADVQVFAVTRGKYKEEREDAVAAFKKAKLPFPILFDNESRVAKNVFKFKKIPAFFVLDAAGRAVTPELNTLDRKVRNWTLERLIDTVRAGKPVPVIEATPVDPESDSQMRAFIGKKAPDFSMHDIRGNIRTPKSFSGKNLILVFWSPTCPHCRRELPRLQQFYQSERGQLGFEILAVASASSTDEQTEGKAFIAQAGIRFPVIIELGNNTSSLYKVRAVPAAYVINKKGYVVEAVTGEHPNVAALYRSVFKQMAGK